MAKRSLDETDRKLITLLRGNARTPTAALGRQLSLSRSAVQERLKRLERGAARLHERVSANETLRLHSTRVLSGVFEIALAIWQASRPSLQSTASILSTKVTCFQWLYNIKFLTI